MLTWWPDAKHALALGARDVWPESEHDTAALKHKKTK
jgi:hypothetical protein